VPLEGQAAIKEGETTLLSPMKEAEKPLGEWNDVQVRIDRRHWLATLNGRTIHEAECSVFTRSPFWVQGGAGFEFRSIEVVPLSQ
jgi:hypothetical protein